MPQEIAVRSRALGRGWFYRWRMPQARQETSQRRPRPLQRCGRTAPTPATSRLVHSLWASGNACQRGHCRRLSRCASEVRA